MAQEQEKKYLGKDGLLALIDSIKTGFAKLVHTHTLSEITDYTVDNSLKSDSTNPVQNKVVKSAIDSKVPLTRTVNGKPLNADIYLNASDVGAATSNDVETAKNTLQTNLDIHTANENIHFTEVEREKLSGIASGAEVNVQADWNVTDTTSDAFIKNKPTSMPANGGNSDTVNGHTVNSNVPENAKFTDTTYSGAGTNLGLVKTGGDVTITDGIITVNDDSHNHVISNVDGLQSALDGKVPTSRTINGKPLSSNISLGASDVGAATPTEVSNVQTNVDKVNTSLNGHIEDADIHVTATNKSNWGAAYTHSQANHARTDATKVENSTTNGNIKINDTETSVYAHPNSGVTAGTYKSVTVNAQGHITSGSNPTTLAGYGITDADAKGAADTALANAKTYADNAVAKVKNDLLNGAGAAYDTLKELGDLIDDNVDAIKVLEEVAAGKADKTHGHEISDITNLQSTLDGKAASSHGTHVSYSDDNPVMDGTASVGSASSVARSDHKHPTDTSRASKSEFDSHNSNTTKHITADERTAWNAAKTHADSSHAPSDAQKNQNAFSNIAVSGQTTVQADTTTDTITFAGSNVTITTDATSDKVTFSVANGSTSAKGVVQLTDATNSTSTTTAATPNSVKSAYDLANTAKDNAATAKTKADSAYDLANSKVGIQTLTSEDLNTVVKEGFYNAGGGNTVTNKPDSVEHFGLYVIHRASGNYYTQILIGHNNKSYRRHCDNGLWGAWSEDKLTDTTYSAAGNSLGLVKTGGDVTITDGTITVKDDSHNHIISNIDDLQATLNGKSNTDHTHNYAGSSSAGGAATSATKVNNSLAIKLNSGSTEGTNLFTFNGSSAKTVNITPSAIGASASGHNHDDKYYTESEIDAKLNGKANSSHGNHVPTVQSASNKVFLRNDNTWQEITPANIGAAKASHGTHVTWTTTSPKMNGAASVGSETKVARGDHVHPVDTSRASKSEFDTLASNVMYFEKLGTVTINI